MSGARAGAGEMAGRGAAVPLVTCVIPAYNHAHEIHGAIDSVLKQTHPLVEIVVVDDGSTDDTAAIVEAIRDARVRCVRQANGGPAAARNTGIANARGEFIGFLDADDAWHAEKVERQLAAFAAEPSLEWCITHAQNVWEGSKLAEEAARFAATRRAEPVPGYVTQCLLARRSLFERIGGFDEARRHSDSLDWFERAKAAGAPGRVLDDVLVFRRIHGENMSRAEGDGYLDEMFDMLKTRIASRRDGAEGGGAAARARDPSGTAERAGGPSGEPEPLP